MNPISELMEKSINHIKESEKLVLVGTTDVFWDDHLQVWQIQCENFRAICSNDFMRRLLSSEAKVKNIPAC